jgi:hypothetical protein
VPAAEQDRAGGQRGGESLIPQGSLDEIPPDELKPSALHAPPGADSFAT